MTSAAADPTRRRRPHRFRRESFVPAWVVQRAMAAKLITLLVRARNADPAELAAVRPYGSRHRRRQTVLAAVDRQLKLGNGGQPA
jgi:hypothetical protein